MKPTKSLQPNISHNFLFLNFKISVMLTRILSTLLSVLVFASAFTQAPCKAIRKDGQTCKAIADTSGYCVAHRPYPTCGALTKKGKPCRNRVTYKGQHCRIHNQGDHAVRIIKSVEEDCLTSVIFVQDGKVWGLDYLTPRELDSLKAIH